MKKGLFIGAVALVVAGGVGFAAIRFLEQPSEDAAISLIPADAYVYGNLFIQPSGDQKRALDDLLGSFPRIESTDQAINRLTGFLDEELEENGLSYDEDVDPWLGDQVSFFLNGTEIDPPDGAGLLETTDPAAAADTLDKIREIEDSPEPEQRSYEGVDYEIEDSGEDVPIAIGFVDDFLVIGTENGFKSVVDSSQGSTEGLADSDEYESAFEGLEDQNILSVFLDQTRLFDLLGESGQLGGPETAVFNAFPGLRSAGIAGFVLSARSDGLAFQSSSSVPDEGVPPLAGIYGGTDLIRELPGDSWVALGIPNLGETVSALIETISEMPGAETASEQATAAFKQETGLDLEEDVLSWMGDAALFVQGTNFQEMGGGVIVESSDPDATKSALTALRARIEREQVPTSDEERGGLEGFSIQAGLPAPIFALAGDRLVVTYGENATDGAIDPDETLGDDATYQAAEGALGDGYSPAFFVDLNGVFEVVEFAQAFSGQTDDTYEQEVKPWVDPLSYVIAGSRTDGDRLYQTFFVGVEAEESS